MRKSNWTAPPDTSSAFGWGPKGRWFTSSRPDLAKPWKSASWPIPGGSLAERGADEVVVGLEGLAQSVDVVLDNVGGRQMVAAWQLLAPGGNLQSVGWASAEPAVFPPYSTVGPSKWLSSFLNQGEAGADLSTLVQLLANGSLNVEIGWRGPWERFSEAVEALRGRRVSGKAVLDVKPAARAPR
jgi:NADPH:quinone reductase